MRGRENNMPPWPQSKQVKQFKFIKSKYVENALRLWCDKSKTFSPSSIKFGSVYSFLK